MKRPVADELRSAEREEIHLPGFRSWRGVYAFVLGCFVVYVVLLVILSRAFS